MELEPGVTNTLTVVVDESMTADRFGNTAVHVLATPVLVSSFELPPTSSPCGHLSRDRGR